ncbi:hypothetical protein RBA41_32435 [Massilia sp. CCM 9210]|uniref:hypothetical protein n=1 Tax=Massilia scottii TaxID=3057166 RepID=UPI002796CA8E|nr:hypothetical protein [Massilia sp. CCM 9210]MDQ1818018.1 hypothetical protein [Massilia sp. CCM 9210]
MASKEMAKWRGQKCLKSGRTLTYILRANTGDVVGALKKILGARTKHDVSSLNGGAAGPLTANGATLRCICAHKKPIDGAPLALDQTCGVGVPYTGFSGLTQEFIKNNCKPAKTHDSSQAPAHQRPDLEYAGNF